MARKKQVSDERTLEFLDEVRKYLGRMCGCFHKLGDDIDEDLRPGWDKSHAVRLQCIGSTMLLMGDLLYDITNRVRDDLLEEKKP